ncbi:hypothetical protein [Pseudomonas alcaligenes]|uniref:hypothetical protein n=1 Tax=Aquipseudomonas alcaligenes TaxID=43263 RepID=UPI00358E11ED
MLPQRLIQALLIGVLSISSIHAAPAVNPTNNGVVLQAFEPGQNDAPYRLDRDPQVRGALEKLLGYGRASYISADTLVLEQVLESLNSSMDIVTANLADGRRLIASENKMTGGYERAALLIEGRKLVAVGLVHGPCQLDEETHEMTCHSQEPAAILTIFLPAGTARDSVQPLRDWAVQLPPLLVNLADARGGVDQVQVIAKTEYVEPDLNAPGWDDKELGLAQPLLALLPKRAKLSTAMRDGQYIAPAHMAGDIFDTGWDDALGQPHRNAEVVLFSHADYAELVQHYRQLAGDQPIDDDGQTARWSGQNEAGVFTLTLEDEQEKGVRITLSVWPLDTAS